MSFRQSQRITHITPLLLKRTTACHFIRFLSTAPTTNKSSSLIPHSKPSWFTSTKYFIDHWLKPRIQPYIHKLSTSSAKIKQLKDIEDPKEAIQRASKVLNELTGYDQIDAVKQKVNNQARLFETTRDQVQVAKRNYEAAIETRSSTQREINELLQRKHAWQDQDVTRFTQLYRLEHEHAHHEQQSREIYQQAERQMDREYMALARSIMERYHEEQLWSDKIRSVSTYGTWALMVINVVLFLVVQTMLEPRKRRRLTDRFEELLVLKMSESEAQIKALVNELEKKEGMVLEKQGAVMEVLNNLMGHPLFDKETIDALKEKQQPVIDQERLKEDNYVEDLPVLSEPIVDIVLEDHDHEQIIAPLIQQDSVTLSKKKLALYSLESALAGGLVTAIAAYLFR